MPYVGVGTGLITRRGQLRVPATPELGSVLAVHEPVAWGVAEDGTKAVLARFADSIESRPELSHCGTSMPEADQTIAVPVPVLESVDGIDPGTEIAFVLNETMANRGMTYLVPMDRAHEAFPELSWGQPGRRF